MKVVLLAGGMGTRLSEETAVRPKPLVEIGGRPILWHIMQTYAAWGYKEYVVALGYKGQQIKEYFLNYYHLERDISIELQTGTVTVTDGEREDWTVHLVDTGFDTQTGGRVKRLKDRLGDETFMLTYGDGVADIDIARLVDFHRAHGKLATITAVRPPARYGGLTFKGDQVTRFDEKPQLGEGWVSGGFFVLEPQVMDYIAGDETHFEREPLERLAADGQLMAYKHTGFWQGMDTLRDVRFLEDLWQRGQAPWRSGT